jgi:hypothetical protein
MRRQLLILAVAAVMAAMMVAVAAPAMAQSSVTFVPISPHVTGLFVDNPSSPTIEHQRLITIPPNPIRPTDPISPICRKSNPNCATDLPPGEDTPL